MSRTRVERGAIVLNGKWLAHSVTGTERYANEVAKIWAAAGPQDVTLHVPADAVVPEWARAFRVRRSRFHGVLFEQVVLPMRGRGRLLVSMGGPAPMLHRRQVAVLHDASVFAIPRAYSRAFALWYRTMYRVLSRGAQTLVTVSQFSAAELSSYLRIASARFTVVPGAWQHMSGIAASSSDAGVLLEGDFVLFLGTPAPHKNIRPTLRAFTRAGVRCVVVGDVRPDVFGGDGGPAAATELFLGRRTDEEVVLLLRRARALVFPSHYEGFGLPILEAQSQDCPVVASSAASLQEVAGSGALFFDPTAPQAAVALVEQLGDAARRDELVRLGRENLRRFSWTTTARAIADLAGMRFDRPLGATGISPKDGSDG